MEEQTVRFLLRHDSASTTPVLYAKTEELPPAQHWRNGYDDLQKDLRLELWRTKALLDPLTDEEYLSARNRVFQLAGGGGRRSHFTNRAGYKLLESMEAADVWEALHATASAGTPAEQHCRKRQRQPVRRLPFADLCGGPGSFSEALLHESRRYGCSLYGFGLTLKGVNGLDWYDSLRTSSQFTITYGSEGSGDILQLSTVDAFVSIAGAASLPLVVADGGFHVSHELENYQETISSRITYAQWFANLKLQALGGSFVLKLFDTFSPLTRSVLYLSTFLYKRVWIVKPRHSRMVNSERYLVCVDFEGLPSGWLEALQRVFVSGFESGDMCVASVLPPAMQEDHVFTDDLMSMNEGIARNQIAALQCVLEEVERARRGTENGEPEPSLQSPITNCDV